MGRTRPARRLPDLPDPVVGEPISPAGFEVVLVDDLGRIAQQRHSRLGQQCHLA